MTKFLNISTDNTLGGNSASDETVSSQKAIKSYVDGLKTDWYGTCSTGASTQAKVVSCTGFVLTTGVSIRVKFTNNQSYNGNPTLNVNGTGALSVKAYGTTNAGRYYWRAGEVVAFTYDGTNWIMEDGATATTSYFGVTALTTSATSTSDTRAATPASINSLVLNMIEPYPVYSSSSTYAVGDKVRYSFNAWVCKTAITGEGEAWNANHWTKIDDVQTQIDGKQANLVSGTNIKTINNTSLLGSGNITVDSLPSQTGQSGKFLTTNGTSASWGSALTSNDVTSIYTATGIAPVNGVAVSNAIVTKQDNLVSGTNIKTINGNSVLGSGNIVIETSSTPSVDGTTISYNSNDSLQTIAVINKNGGTALPIWQGTETQWNRGEATTWYYWQTSVSSLWINTTLPSSDNWSSIAYNGSLFVAVGKQKYMYSSNGIDWVDFNSPSQGASPLAIAFGNGLFVVLYSSFVQTSPDGTTWTKTYLPDGTAATYSAMIYGGGKFVAISQYGFGICSEDGVNWTKVTLPREAPMKCISYGDGKFVVPYYGAHVAYSYNGIDWVETDLPVHTSWDFTSVSYGSGKFVAIASGYVITSEDGINWTNPSIMITFIWPWRLAYGNEMFLAIYPGSSIGYYSVDGLSWVQTPTIATKGSWSCLVYGDNKFVTVSGSNSNVSAYFSIQYDKCYTDTANPTTSSIIYSQPETASALTISSTTSGAITLSNNNTYYYNQSGNTYTYQSIGVAHPDWLCFINGVGVKIGTTTIATNNT